MNTQFDLGTMLSGPAMNSIQQIPCEQLHPYHNHKFELYSGERLEDMVASIKENGVLSPIIVQPDGDGYEILIGHNRWNASKIAGLLAECAEECKIDMKNAKKLREAADSEGNIAPDTVHAILYGEVTEVNPKPKSVKISNATYNKYFKNGEKPKEITETIKNNTI